MPDPSPRQTPGESRANPQPPAVPEEGEGLRGALAELVEAVEAKERALLDAISKGPPRVSGPAAHDRVIEALRAARAALQAPAGDGEAVGPWKTAVCPVHGFTIPRDHNLGWGRCSVPRCHKWHEVRTFYPAGDGLRGGELNAANRMAAAVDLACHARLLDARSQIADARLDYGDPLPREKAQAIWDNPRAALEASPGKEGDRQDNDQEPSARVMDREQGPTEGGGDQ